MKNSMRTGGQEHEHDHDHDHDRDGMMEETVMKDVEKQKEMRRKKMRAERDEKSRQENPTVHHGMELKAKEKRRKQGDIM